MAEWSLKKKQLALLFNEQERGTEKQKVQEGDRKDIKIFSEMSSESQEKLQLFFYS